MGFAQYVWNAFKETAYEFQAGPKKKRKLKKFPKLRIRLKREPEPRRPRLKPEPKGFKEKKRPEPKGSKEKIKYIKRERAIISAPQELQEWEKGNREERHWYKPENRACSGTGRTD